LREGKAREGKRLRIGVKWSGRGVHSLARARAHEDLYLPERQLSGHKSALDRGELRTRNDGRIAEISSLENGDTASDGVEKKRDDGDVPGLFPRSAGILSAGKAAY